MVHPGDSTGPVPIMLESLGMPSSLCAVTDGGTAGNGGAGGTGGGAGMGGASGDDGGGGNGGSVGAAGGASGSGGSAGLGGTGGMAGGGGNGGLGGLGGGLAGAGGGPAGAGGGAGCDLTKPFGEPVLVPVINSTFDEYAIWLTRDGLSAVVASNRSDLGGPGDYDLYRTTRSAINGDFGLPTLLRNVNTANAETRPVLSPNGLNLFFSSDRPRSGTGYDVYVSSRPNLSADFGAPALVAAASSAVSDLLHSVTADGQYLYFDRPVSGTGRDIFVMNLTTGGTPTPVPELNSQYDEGHAILSDDLLTVYFASTRIGLSTSGGSAAANILTAHRSTPTGSFTNLALVSELNTDSADIPSYLSPDGCTIYLDSDRSGRLHLWVAVKP
jgi:Tol biopolymer transport system component